MSSIQELAHSLLRLAETLSDARLEKEYPVLPETTTASITLSESSYEVKLECISERDSYVTITSSVYFRWILYHLINYLK